MVYKVIIRDNAKTPIRYLPDLDNFKNGAEYEFKTGVNIIVGENGCGKTTLLNLIKRYLMIDYMGCGKGIYNCNVNCLYGAKNKFLDGADVYADYQRNTFRLSHAGEKEQHRAIETFEDFGTMFNQKHASTGEGVLVAINSLWDHIWGKKSQLLFDYRQFKESDPLYWEYIKAHHQEGSDEWTVLMDEPDRNLSIENIGQVKGILSMHKPQVQIIAVVHNPLLIYSLSKNPGVNIIEMTPKYIKKVKNLIKNILK
jgi:predicted ATPase